MINVRRLETQPGATQYRILQEKNLEIQVYNDNSRLHQKRMKERYPYWEFKRKIEGGSKGEGFDWFMYREQVLIARVYLFLRKLEAECGHEVWLVDDNGGNHTLAAKMACSAIQDDYSLGDLHLILHRVDP